MDKGRVIYLKDVKASSCKSVTQQMHLMDIKWFDAEKNKQLNNSWTYNTIYTNIEPEKEVINES